MSGPPPPPPPPDPQPYRVIAYPNYFISTLEYGDEVTIKDSQGASLTATLMDLSPYGLTLWHAEQLHHLRWDEVRRLSWTPQP